MPSGTTTRSRPALALGVCLLATALNAADVSLSVSANRTQIYLGESIILSVKVAGADNTAAPDLSALTDFETRFLGSQSNSRHSITMVNGRVRRESFRGRTFTYELVPAKAGKLAAGPVTLSEGGRTLSDPGPTITVSGLEQQPWVYVKLEASRQAVLVDEPFSVTLMIEMLSLGGRYASVDPMSPADPPHLQVAFLDNAPIQGLESPEVTGILQNLLASRPQHPGFAINDYKLRGDPFDFGGFFSFGNRAQRPARFAFPRTTVTRDRKKYQRYSLKLTYVPKQEGSYTFGPAVFKGSVLTAIDAAGKPNLQPVFAVGPAVTVRVTPPPEEGRPASFIGAIGSNLLATASLDAQTCNVGDPLKLTLSVSGPFSINNVYPPVLSDQTALTHDFRIYDDSVQTEKKDGAIDFVYTLRPTRAGTLELPPVEVSYYDAVARAYRTVSTRAIPLRARETAEVGETIILSTATGGVEEADHAPRRNALVPAPLNVNSRGALPDGILRPRLHLALAAAGPAAWAASLLFRLLAALAARHSRSGRHKRVYTHACALLRSAVKRAEDDPRAARRLVCEAMSGYLAGRFEGVGRGVTPGDAGIALDRAGIDPALRRRFDELFERNFNAGFTNVAPGEAADADALAAREVLTQLERTREKR